MRLVERLSPLSTQRRQLAFVTVAGALTLLALLLAGGALLRAGTTAADQRQALCRAANQTRDVLRQVLELARLETRKSLERRHSPIDARYRAEQFYERELELVKPVRGCM